MSESHGPVTPPPGGAASPRFALATLAAAGLGALALPGIPLGLGLALVCAAVAGAVTLARPAPPAPQALVLLALSLALAATSLFRAATWVVLVNVVYAAWLGCMAVTLGRRWSDMAKAPASVVSRAHQAPAFLARSLGSLGWRPTRSALPALRGVAMGAGLVLFFGGLFASADEAFGELAWSIVPEVDLLGERLMVFVGLSIAAASLAAAGRPYSGLGRPWLIPPPAPHRLGKALGRIEWGTALGLLVALFAFFVAVQLSVLFGGRRHVLDTIGLSYAEYARQGFFQLVLVAALTLGVVAGAVRWARREDRASRVLFRVILGALCALTLVVLYSALRRLQLYEATFGFTRTRLMVHATILWMAGLFVLVMAAGIRLRAPWLPLAVTVFTGVSLLVFSSLNPDGTIASRNVERFEATGSLDTRYLRSSLSADAVPALSSLPPGPRGCVVGPIASRLGEEDPWMGFNFARRRAREVLALESPGECGNR